MGYKMAIWPVILFLIFLSLYAFGVVPGYWTLMLAVIFIVVGFVVGVVLLGSGRESMKMGIPMLILGIILFLIVYFFPR
jgi:energy-coupling factor transporter transmembrane protein EcfT